MFTVPVSFFGTAAAVAPPGLLQPTGTNYGVKLSGSPIPLGGYNVTPSAPNAAVLSRFYAQVDAVCTIIVRVNGLPAHGAINVGPGEVFQDITVSIATGDSIDFHLESGTPTSVYAFIDQGAAP